MLVVERGYRQSGYQCAGCGYLTAQEMDRCLFCGGTFVEIPDAAEAAASLGMTFLPGIIPAGRAAMGL